MFIWRHSYKDKISSLVACTRFPGSISGQMFLKFVQSVYRQWSTFWRREQLEIGDCFCLWYFCVCFRPVLKIKNRKRPPPRCFRCVASAFIDFSLDIRNILVVWCPSLGRRAIMRAMLVRTRSTDGRELNMPRKTSVTLWPGSQAGLIPSIVLVAVISNLRNSSRVGESNSIFILLIYECNEKNHSYVRIRISKRSNKQVFAQSQPKPTLCVKPDLSLWTRSTLDTTTIRPMESVYFYITYVQARRY